MPNYVIKGVRNSRKLIKNTKKKHVERPERGCSVPNELIGVEALIL